MDYKRNKLFNKDIGPEEIYNFLNLEAYKFYDFKGPYLGIIAKFKQLLLIGFNYIERTIKGTFGCDIFMKNADINTLNKMYPLACSNKMFNVNSKENLKLLGRTLDNIRNINAHYILYPIKRMFLEYNYDFLNNFEPINKNIVYLKNNKITLAGIIFIMLCFLRAESIKELSKINKIIGIISCGDYVCDDGNYFVNEISKTNLEIDIRQDIGNDLSSSIIGEYKHLIDEEDELKCIKIGVIKNPTYKVYFNIDNNEVFIKEGSLTKIYYENDYKLIIKNINEFISFSNKLPPFVFVDYLYGKGITTFDEKAIETVNNEFQLISKLNHPKFYINKNLNIILLGNKWADLRLMASLFNSHISDFYLGLISRIYACNNLNHFYSIKAVLEDLGVNSYVIEQNRILRNFVAHGYIINESMFVKDKMVKYTFEDAIKTIKNLCDDLSNHPDLQTYVMQKLNKCIVNPSIQAKYQKVRLASIEYINNSSENNLKILSTTNGWIDNSGFDINLFLILGDYLKVKFSFIKIESNSLQYPLYLSDSTTDMELLENYMNENHFTLKEKKEKGLIQIIKIEKKGS